MNTILTATPTTSLSTLAGSFSRSAQRMLRREPALAVSGALIVLLVLAALFAPAYARDPNAVQPSVQARPASTTYLFGTDNLGRDQFSRVVYGARVSLLLGFSIAAVAGIGALIIGAVSGFEGGQMDSFLQRVMDVFMVFPGIVLAIALVSVLGFSLSKFIFAISIVEIPRLQRVFRASAQTLREDLFIEAARSIGAGRVRIVLRHLLPQLYGLFLALFTSTIATAIIIEASLSYLGLGLRPPTSSWGALVSSGAVGQIYTAPHIILFPAVTLALTIVVISLFGDSLRDVSDPRLRHR